MFSKKGFTLIELMIVIAVIAVLTTLVLVGLGQMQKRGRDTQRVATANGVRTALECYNGTAGVYPTSFTWNQVRTQLGSGCFTSDTLTDPSTTNIPSNGIVTGIATYSYAGISTGYTIVVYGESGRNYTVKSPL